MAEVKTEVPLREKTVEQILSTLVEIIRSKTEKTKVNLVLEWYEDIIKELAYRIYCSSSKTKFTSSMGEEYLSKYIPELEDSSSLEYLYHLQKYSIENVEEENKNLEMELSQLKSDIGDYLYITNGITLNKCYEDIKRERDEFSLLNYKCDTSADTLASKRRAIVNSIKELLRIEEKYVEYLEHLNKLEVDIVKNDNKNKVIRKYLHSSSHV
jgi:hypothetical protein